jgi:hypothetical protein
VLSHNSHSVGHSSGNSPVNRDIKMAPPCKSYRKVYTWQVTSIRHIISIAKFATLGVAARPDILENRGGKSHFCDYFIIRARYTYLSYYKKCKAYNSLHFLFFMFFLSDQ